VALDLARGLDRDEDGADDGGGDGDVDDIDLRAVVSFHGVLDAPTTLRGRARGNARVAIFHGAADPFSPPERARACLEDLTARGVRDVAFKEWRGVKHAFTRPEKVTPEDHEAGFGYDENAATESWRACVEMLDDAFAR
jgi:dienelactone hydrolase